MKIAQVAPLYEAVPPVLYGGTERIVHYLVEALVRQGHDVTLFASADSKTSAKLQPCVEKAIRLNSECEDSLAPHIAELQLVAEMQDEFDIIHFHTDYISFPFAKTLTTPHVTTLHGKLTIPELKSIYSRFNEPVVSISNDQRKPLPEANFVANVYHGLPQNLHKTGTGQGNYLAFLGRISPEKGVENAIEWAKTSGMQLKIAAKVDEADLKYFEACVKPLLNHPNIEFIGEIDEAQKTDFLGNAAALVFPIEWNEPFGLVMIEAMACGTPVIAHGRGSVPEVLDEGLSGFIVASTQQAVDVIKNLDKVNRNAVRQRFDERFTADRMAQDYISVYESLRTKMNLRVEHKGVPGYNPLPGLVNQSL